jgi:formylglycine-generating enzyme required for sulfatase activity
MFRFAASLFAVIGSCLPTYALTGSGDSPAGALETVPPVLDAITVTSDASVEAAFSEPLLAPGGDVPGNYTLSGLGAGTLTPTPDSVTGSGPYGLLWSSGEMLDGGPVTLTVNGVQDALGNPIDTGANSASATGMGIPPVFSGLTVTPTIAGPGDTVSISFSASEDLDTEPTVSVNGNLANFTGSAKATSFAYEYTVEDTDPMGTAAIEISGFDPAGNLGTLSGSFTIIEAATLPLSIWPAAIALFLAGLVVLLRRRGAVVLALLLFAAPSALAQAPTVSNVAFSQQATATGTEVIITYDLDSPNGPSDITVSLSKDGGSDGFVFPVTSVTGDVTGVSSGTEHTITWDIAEDYPNEDIPNAQLRLTADDGLDLPEMISVPAGSFDMGNSGVGDDATFGNSDELPVHTVTLSAYAIGKFEVTNQQVCDVYNWADDQGLFTTVDATTAQAFGQELLDLDASGSHIEYVAGVFQPESRTGLPDSTLYSMADYPVQEISWFGAVAFCNWLSQMEGLTPVYETSTWTADFATDGYHLPTEAQWERAAAWDGNKHWIYSFTSDTLTGRDRATYNDGSGRVNPLGLTSFPETSPVGWFDGSNVSPNGGIATQDSVSPIGAYDMSGNVWEWCHDWYDSGYYGSGAAIGPDPEGAASGSERALRGGAWSFSAKYCRSAHRTFFTPSSSFFHLGFRLARNTSYSLDYSAGAGGSLTGDTAQTVLPGADGTSIEAVPDTGYTFVDWSDGVTDNPRTDTNAASGLDVTANFDSLVDLPELISVEAGSFDMGNSGVGDDATYGNGNEMPIHAVKLSAYEIGKFEVTNQQVCDVFNWADDQGLFMTVNANTAAGFGLELLDLDSSTCHIEYVGGVFQPETRTGNPGGSTAYTMADHPVQEINWYGAVAYCNWLSQIFGLAPVYDTSTWTANFANDGYHLPTEAQWERAAAWDSAAGGKHWIHSFTSDTLTGKDRANYVDYDPNYVNPLGLTLTPYTTPVGWFDGVNVSPNGSIQTVNSVSPVGAYDMTGNVWE